MTEFTYALFDEHGRCTSIMRSAVELDLAHPVERGSKPENIYQDAQGEVSLRKHVTISCDRDHFLNDGRDAPVITGLPDDAVLMVNNVVTPVVTSEYVGAMMIETVGEYASNTLVVMFAPRETLVERLTAKIDELAGEARARHLTVAPGMAEIYACKEAEARAFTVDPLGTYPFLAAETGGDMVAARELAATIIDRADACNVALAKIEALRMTAKRAISEATDASAMVDAMQIEWGEL